MSIKINSLPNISFPKQSETKTDENAKSANDNVVAKFETSSTNNFQTLEGQMRKLQLLQQFASSSITNNKPLQANLVTSAKRLGGDDEAKLRETQRLIDNYRRQIKPEEVKGAQPVAPGMSPGHANSGHKVKPEVQAEIMNKPERVFSGKNDNGRYVDIYYKNGSAVITVQGDKGRVITAYGLINQQKNVKTKPFKLEKITSNPNFAEVQMEKLGATNVIYPNKARFDAKDFPPGPPKTNVPPKNNTPPKTNGGGSNAGETAEIKPNVNNPSGARKLPAAAAGEPPVLTEAPAAIEPPINSKTPPVIEEMPATPSPLGKLTGNLSRGLIVMQLVQLGLAVLNFSKLEADGEKFGYYIHPFLDKYVIVEPEKAAEHLPEGFVLNFSTTPNDFYSSGRFITFTVKDGKFFNADGYMLRVNEEKGYVEAVLMA